MSRTSLAAGQIPDAMAGLAAVGGDMGGGQKPAVRAEGEMTRRASRCGRGRAEILRVVGHASHADVAVAVAAGVALEPSIEIHPRIEIGITVPFADDAKIGQLQAGDRLVAQLGGRPDLGRLGEGLEAVESLAGRAAQAVRRGPRRCKTAKACSTTSSPAALARSALPAQREAAIRGAYGNDQQEESDKVREGRQGRVAAAPPPARSTPPTGRARIGSPARNRRRSSARARRRRSASPGPSAGTSSRSSPRRAAAPAAADDGATGSADLTCSSVSSTVAARNGGRPVSSS